MKTLLSLVAILAMTSACTSVSTTRVGDKDIVHVTELQVQILNNGGAPVTKCIDTLGKEGVEPKNIISNAGQPTGGLFGLTRSVSTIGVDVCNAVGEK